jgi:Toprim domain-containing protein
MLRLPDPLVIPGTRETPQDFMTRTLPLSGTAGQAYIERRGIPLGVAEAAAVRFTPDFAGRPAVLVALHGSDENMTSVHGRYLTVSRGQDKMLTIGSGGGTINVLGGWRIDPVIIVEGLFDALSLSVAGFASIATIGRWAPWLPDALAGRTVWLAFDNGSPGEEEVARYADRLRSSHVRRMVPPGHRKDWNTALVKLGVGSIAQHVQSCLANKK